ncbi:DUF7373 family lipoprotein [Nocardia caishijiensis]|uniref:Uncharacterized protein n=1 Tax=Nocardia caishijiensis TaxID=184756 RepID=A0ABQ6YRE1_9NOCA|nr:hypothetical protein [Nocardia caishijiensis]KAF0848334.1 hypothetical protein FNL39_102482 [Nocardia caishijiensis]
MRKLRLSSTLVAFGLLLSACGGSEAATPTAPEIDVAKLDSGNYPTTPVDLEPTRVATSGALREAIRIGAATPLPVQYDSRFVFAKGQSGGLHLTTIDAPYFSGTGLEGDAINATLPGIVAGWETSGDRRDQINAGRTVSTVTLRFETADQALHAATELSNRAPGSPYPIPNYSDAPAKLEPKPVPLPSQNLRAWLPRGDLLLYILVTDWLGLPYDPAADAVVAQKYFDKQIEMLRSYSPTPLSDIAKLPLDTEGLLSRTLPTEAAKRPERTTSSSAVYPAQAALHVESHPSAALAAYTDAGIDYVAFDAASVYRTRDTDAAARFHAWLDSEISDDEAFVEADAPPNMPTFTCFSVDPKATSSFMSKPTCQGTVGRYAIAVSASSMQDAHQRIAAQYKLLHGFS